MKLYHLNSKTNFHLWLKMKFGVDNITLYLLCNHFFPDAWPASPFVIKHHHLVTTHHNIMSTLCGPRSLPIRKCIVKFRLHSFHSKIKDWHILNQQFYKKINVLKGVKITDFQTPDKTSGTIKYLPDILRFHRTCLGSQVQMSPTCLPAKMYYGNFWPA